ncbi:Putative lipid kinase BmrU [Rubripirellula lacrimiformis]|uniref:Lipid kinase BmrU n=2 Tax=Rubripirellula lacrimiformis TaxID=1930273 RepID=A0A517N9C0_9BACT|nr:Putative lipid kinase BmrU [Rubripirellula lacrimiformis]
MPDVVIFTSPNAGTGAGRQQLPRLVDRLREHHVRSTIVDSVAQLVAAVDGSPNPIVVAAGGDGTLSLACESIGADVPIVPMPMGTENLLAKHFGHRSAADAVLETIRFGREVRLDVGQANGKPFLIMATCGFDAEVVRGMHLTRRGHIHRLSYLRPILRAVRHYSFPGLEIRVDGGPPIHAGWAMVFNLPRYATSLSIEPDAMGDDGQLDLIAFQGRSVLTGLRYLAGITTSRHLNFSDVIRRRGTAFQISASQDVNASGSFSGAGSVSTDGRRKVRVPVQLDGDFAGRLPVTIRTLPGRVRLLVPAEVQNFAR